MANQNELATQNNAMVEHHGVNPAGLEGIVDTEAIPVPAVIMLQKMSPQLDDEDYNFKAGQLIHSFTMEEVPESFVPLLVWQSNILFQPRTEEGKALLKSKYNIPDEVMSQNIICSATDGVTGSLYGKCSLCKKHKFDNATGSKPDCQATINILALFDGHQMPTVIRFSKSSLKHGNKFVGLLRYAGGAIYEKRYKLAAIKRDGDNGAYYELTVKPMGKLEDAEVAYARSLYEEFKGSTIDIQDPNEHDDDDVVTETEY